MLEKHLVVKTYGKADTANIVLWNDYRVTVLADRLFRIEKNAERIWRDAATQSVWYRNMPKQNFAVEQNAKFCKIKTKSVELVLKENRKDCRVVINGKSIAIDNSGNLLGTCRTLDNCDGDVVYASCADEEKTAGNVKLGFGVCSKNGVAALDDSQSLTLGENGKIIAEKAVGGDEYVFAYDNDYRGAVRALYMITGAMPMLPRYSLGNWWSRYYPYTEKNILQFWIILRVGIYRSRSRR